MKTRGSSHREKQKTRVDGALPRVIIITGLSGSGKTVALRAVEDAHFFCVDNLPVSLIDSLIAKISVNTKTANIAIGIDIREKEFLTDIDTVLKNLRNSYSVETLFLEAETPVLLRRFKETRRPHPLGGVLEGAIRKEKRSLALLREHADRIIDTSSLSPHELRKLILSLIAPVPKQKDLSINLISFGFKHGIPQNVDLLFDVRFLPNPNFVPRLKPLNGTDKRVADYIFKDPATKEFKKRFKNLLDFLIPQYIKEGKSYLSIAVGCTGGTHRSPAVVEDIAKNIARASVDLAVIHRDMS